jgi:hypothetical protein
VPMCSLSFIGSMIVPISGLMIDCANNASLRELCICFWVPLTRLSWDRRKQ